MITTKDKKLNKGQKRILLVIIAYVLLWNTSYFWENLPGLLDLVVLLLLMAMSIGLAILGIVQVVQYSKAEQPSTFRLATIITIALILVLSYFKPLGLFNLEGLEGETLLEARREGTANCTFTLQLKENHRFKKKSICFGVDQAWGTYKIVKDTIQLHYDTVTEADKAGDYAVLHFATGTDEPKGRLLYHSKGLNKEGVPLFITTIKKEALDELQ